MELLYNPDQMPESEVKETFVAREQLLDDLVELIKGQPEGAGVQHAVIIAPRGMGKTTVLLMVKFAVKDRGLVGQWQAVKFPEESYGIYDLADLWIQTLELIAADTGDAELRRLTNDLKIEYPKNDELQEAAYAAIRYWRRKHGKRLLLLVENFDQILEQINDERDNARLRDVLMNDGTIMILGGATNFFKEARAYDQPLYNFFKIYDLDDLKLAQMQELLRRRARVDRIADFEATLKQNASRLRALKYFTGGNPRLVLMLYRVVSRSNVTEVRRALEKLLDEVTPYYKAKVEMLPPQQRKILDHIARVSGQTSQGITPKEIAEAVRLPQNQTSAQLKRLAELGYVRTANLRGRSSHYMLSEPLYAIWHQMRFGHEARERMKWLVTFLKVWYATEEIGAESQKLVARFRRWLKSGRKDDAIDVLEHQRLLADASSDSHMRSTILGTVVKGFFDLGSAENNPEESLRYFDQAIKIEPENHHAWFSRGSLLSKLGRYEEAIASYNHALENRPECGNSLLGRAHIFFVLQQYEEAIQDLKRVTETNPDLHGAWCSYVAALNNLGRCEEAIAIWDNAFKTDQECPGTWYCHAFALAKLGRYEDAAASYDRVLEIKPDNDLAWNNRGHALGKLGRHEGAVASYDRALEIKPDDDLAWNNRGIALGELGRHEDAVASFDRALEIKPDRHNTLVFRGIALGELGRREDAVASFDRALEIKPDNDLAWYNRGIVFLNIFSELAQQGKFDAAKQKWNEALASGSKSNDEDWLDEIVKALLEIAKVGRLGFARQLIAEAGMEERLFPLARAIDYLQTGDEALIEKLSPEVRGIVEEVVAKLRAIYQAGS
jgi:tetratricopeptide (TPR) repeat protein